MSRVRVGQGLDVHRFSDDPARPLVLGGLHIADGPGLAGHSDADVVLHALVDALLGAAGLGDLGTRYGTDDPAYAGAASAVFLEDARARVRDAGWDVANVDLTVVAERPRLGPHRERIRDAVAGLLEVDATAVNVKATTTDGLGVLGRGEGAACLAVVLIERR